MKTAWKKFREFSYPAFYLTSLRTVTCVQLFYVECDAPSCQWNIAIDLAKPSAFAAQRQGHDQTDLQYQAKGCGHRKVQDSFWQSLSSRTLTSFSLVGHVEHSSGAVRTPCDIQVHGSTPGRPQSKTPILSRNIYKKLLETEFSIAICHHTGDK